MIGNPQELRALTRDLAHATLALSNLGVVFESGLVETLREPHTLDELAAAHPAFGKDHLRTVLELAAADGAVVIEAERYRLAPGLMPASQPPMRQAVQGEIRSVLLQSLAFVDAAASRQPTAGWRHADPALLQAQGDSSAGLPAMFKMMVVPQLAGLAERLARPGARFLDVGVGVGALAISMCRLFPEVCCVGVDVNDRPLALARDNVARAELAGRIELRKVAIEQLADADGFDLAWLPSFFIPAGDIDGAARAVHGAIRPGGWVIVATISPAGSPRSASAGRLLADLWGGGTFTNADAEALLARAGFTEVRTLPGPAGGGMIVGQR